MKVLIPPSEGKAKVKPQDITFDKTNFIFEKEVRQVVRLLELIDNEEYFDSDLEVTESESECTESEN